MRRARGGEKGHRRHDDLGARAQPERARGHVQRGGSVGADDGVLGVDGLGERGFEAADRRAGGQKVAAQRFADGLRCRLPR